MILSLDEAAGGTSTATAAAPVEKKPVAKAPKKAKPEPEAEAEAETEEEDSGEASEGEIVNENPVASPSVRKVARELAIDLRKIQGSESGGRIVWEDLRNYIARLEKLAASKKPAKPGAERYYNLWRYDYDKISNAASGILVTAAADARP